MKQLMEDIAGIIETAQDIVVVQADNPDGDSIGTALALEQILHELGKNPTLYCGVTIPSYLRYLHGWDRIVDTLPKKFDATIFVDVSTMTLLEQIQKDASYHLLAKKPSIVLDHHVAVEQKIPYATVELNDSTKSSTGELLFELARCNNWPITAKAGEPIMTAILGDTQGLSNELTGPETYRVMAELVDIGVNRPALENRRRLFSKMPQSIYLYKGELIKRTMFALDNKLAMVVIPQHEIETYSLLYNPGPLIQTDMLQVADVAIAIVLKRYDDGKTTGAIRSNNGYKIAGDLAAHLGGGGHPFAAGFKIQNQVELSQLTDQITKKVAELLISAEASHD